MTPRTADRERDLAFTSYLRVAAIAGVVLIHVLAAIVGNDEIREQRTWWIATSLDLGVAWSVPVFVMVSGALLLRPTGESAGEFYRRRLRRIGIPLVVAHVGYLGVRVIVLGQELTAAGILGDLLNARVFTHLYFFWIVLGLYLVTPALRIVVAASSTRTILALGLGAVVWMWVVTMGAGALAQIGISVTPWQPAALTLWIPYLGYFLLGYALSGVVLRPHMLILVAGAFFAASAAVIWQFAEGRSAGVPSVVLGGGYLGMPVAIAAVAVVLAGRSIVRPGSALARPAFARPMRYLGELSLGVFIVHPLLLLELRRTSTFVFTAVKASLSLSLTLWVVTLVLSFAACAVLARIPLVRRAIGL